MQTVSVYMIEVRGRLEEQSINAASPIHISVKRTSDSKSLITARTDQSGIVGLIRFLHRQGFIILSLKRKQELELKK